MEGHSGPAVHLPRLRRQSVDGHHLALSDLRIARDRDLDDLRVAVAERNELHTPENLAVDVGPRRPRLGRQMADRANGSPSASTYRRWITGEAIVPAWALQAAAEVAGLSLHGLLEPHDVEAPPDDWRARVEDAIGRLESEMIEVRQHVGLPWQSDEQDTGAGPSPTVRRRSTP
jgi:hypothetical protein